MLARQGSSFGEYKIQNHRTLSKRVHVHHNVLVETDELLDVRI